MVFNSRLFGAVLAIAVSALPVRGETPGKPVELTLSQARQVALKLALSGRPDQAETMARALLEADPEDDAAWFAIAQAWRLQGDPGRARQGAARAFRYGDDALGRTQAAGLAAQAAFDEKRFTLSQYWLRRSAQVAPSEAARAQIAQSYAHVRARNPLSVQLRFSLAPSSNLNGGAQSHLNEIDGISAVGVLSGSAMALSGLDARSTVELSYRLAQSERSVTRAHGLVYLRKVRLSDEARAIAPTVTNSDLSLRVFEAGLSHAWRLGSGDAMVQVRGDLGQVISAGDPYHSYHRLTGQASGRLTGQLTHRLRLSREVRNPSGSADPEYVHTVGGALTWNLPRDAMVELSGQRKLIDEAAIARDGTSDSISLKYRHGTPILGVDLGVDLAIGRAVYPDYTVGFIPVPDGRKDHTKSAALHMDFTTLDYMGFVPRVSVRAYQTKSNVSRFETDGVSLALGFRSAF